MQQPNLISRELIAAELPAACRDCPFVEHLNQHALQRFDTDEDIDRIAITEAIETAESIGELAVRHNCTGHEEVRVVLSVPDEQLDRIRVARMCGISKIVIAELGPEYSEMSRHRMRYTMPHNFTS